MKDIKRLELSLRITEGVYLALMTLCVSVTCALLLQGNREGPALWWGLGAVLPVELLAGLCYWLKKPLIRVLACVGVLALTVLLTLEDARWVYYVVCCGFIMLSGLVMDRPKGKLIFTFPKAYHVVYGLIVYAIGKMVSNQILCILGIIIAALQVLIYFFYTGRVRLLRNIRDSKDTELSATEMIRLNRRSTLAYFLLAIAILVTVPMLLSRPERKTDVVPTVTGVPLASNAYEALDIDPLHVVVDPDNGTPISYEGVGNVLLVIGVLFCVCVVILVFLAIWQYIRMFLGDDSKSKDPPDREGWSLERLKPMNRKTEKERLTGYEKRLRRRYERLILSRTDRNTALNSLTPAELEQAAKLSGPGLDTIHELYEKTRYSPEPTDRERYAAFKEAVKQLDETT